MHWLPTLTTFVELLLPPMSLAPLALIVLLVWRRRAGRVVAGLLLAALTAFSTPAVGGYLLDSLDVPGVLDGPEPSAIVILSADVVRTADAAGIDLGPLTLERLRAGAALFRLTHLPILVTGGIVIPPTTVAALMVRSLVQDFRVPVRWAEARSGTTWENATFSEAMLRQSGIKRVYVVTHAWHMRRSLLAFRRAGLEAVPWVVRADVPPRLSLGEFVPRASGWERSYFAIHEWIGLLLYWLRS